MNIKLKVVNKGSDKLTPLKLPALEPFPFVSVLIVNYNYARYVGEAIESVLRQTYQRFEIVVVDDGSTDNSCQVIESYAASDARVRLISKPNGGVASALNTAYAHARGGILCILDADDLFLPRKLEAVVAQFQREPQTGLMLHAMTIVDQFGHALQQMPFLSQFETGWIAERVLRRGGRYRNMPASALSLRREAADLVFPICESTFRSLADGFIFTTLPLLTRVGAVPQVLAEYKIHGANLTGAFGVNREAMQKGIADLQRVLDGTNLRLEKLGYGDRKLDSERNLTLIGQRLALTLLDSKSWSELVRAYLHYSSLLLRDDMFGIVQKLAYVAIYGLAIILPASLRRRWLDQAHSPALKLQTQRAVETVTGLFRVKPRREAAFKA